MRVAAYFLALASAFVCYWLFALYSAFLHLASWTPLLSSFLSVLVFGFFSWLHLFLPRAGAVVLTLGSAFMYFTWPVFLLLGYLRREPMIGPLEAFLPLVLIIPTIALVWRVYRRPITMQLKYRLLMAIPAGAIGGYGILSYATWFISLK